jgi:hypothetical protein
MARMNFAALLRRVEITNEIVANEGMYRERVLQHATDVNEMANSSGDCHSQ